MNYIFKMQATDAAGSATGAVKNLEADYPGLFYSKFEGLELQGKAKNIYKESYAEQNGPRVFHPADKSGSVTHEETKVKLTLLFTSKTAYRDFRTYLNSGRLFYWDTARHLKAWLLFEDEPVIQTDEIKDGGYLVVEFPFTNMWGMSKPCNDSGTLV